jgi:hypothetical protein
MAKYVEGQCICLRKEGFALTLFFFYRGQVRGSGQVGGRWVPLRIHRLSTDRLSPPFSTRAILVRSEDPNDLIDLVFNKSRASDRRGWLLKHASPEPLNSETTTIPYILHMPYDHTHATTKISQGSLCCDGRSAQLKKCCSLNVCRQPYCSIIPSY